MAPRTKGGPETLVPATDSPRPAAVYRHGMNVAGGLRTYAERHGRRAALGLDVRTFAARSARVATLLRERGARPGEPVAIMLPDVPEFAVVAYGVLWAGAVAAPVSTALPPADLAAYLTAQRVRHLFAWHAVAETADAATSGTPVHCLFVVPGEFERLLRTVPPSPAVHPRDPADPALLLPPPITPPGALTHGDLARLGDVPDLYARAFGTALY
jgi:long-chain acyl-CoA synthetase